MKLSPFFTTEEATRSSKAVQLGIDNSMDAKTLANAQWFVDNVLDKIRIHIGVPFILTSWYRSPALNKAVGGKPTSSHLSGMAIDFTLKGYTAKQSYDIVLVALKDLRIPFDQLIIEHNTKTNAQWVHLGAKKTGNRNQSFALNV